MKTTIWGQAAPAVRKAMNFAAPALVVGLLLGSQAYGVVYPPGAVGQLERSVDALLLKERVDILRENALIQTQNAISNVINILNVKISQTTDPNELAFLQQQLALKQRQYNQFGNAISVQSSVLQRNLTVVNPLKDRTLQQLAVVGRNQKQVAMFITAAVQREQSYASVMRAFLQAHPVTAIIPF